MGPFTRLIILLVLAYLVYRYVSRWLGLGAATSAGPRAQSRQIQDLVQCPVCRTYVAPGFAACGRPDCPRPR